MQNKYLIISAVTAIVITLGAGTYIFLKTNAKNSNNNTSNESLQTNISVSSPASTDDEDNILGTTNSTNAIVKLPPGDSCVCNINAYCIDPDIYANTSHTPGGSIAYRMPTHLPNEADFNTMLRVKGYNNNWLQIAEVYDLSGAEKYNNNWIFSALIGVSTKQDSITPLYKNTNTASGKMPTGIIGAERTVVLFKCCNNWVYTEGVNVDGSNFMGWLAPQYQCSNPVSTCP